MDGDELTELVITSGLIVVLTILALAIIQLLAKRALRIVHGLRHLREGRRQQLATFIQIIQWGAAVLILGSAVLMLLSTFGVDITPLLASAGVAGLAVSLGAQSLIKDFLAGVLILSENQYAIGDTIQVGDVSGDVERLSLRATYVRDVNGYLYTVPNGEVRIVANQSRGWSRAIVDIGVAYEVDLDRALHVLEESAATFAQDSTFGPQLLDSPNVLGPLSLGDWAVTVRAMVKTEPGMQWQIARELRRWLLAACEREGIELPYPRQEILLRHRGHDDTQPGDG
jgi:small conductance mechanosensitive channel